jgi:hypothetical protein
MTAPVEDRLREALAARAGRITAADLHPAPLPSRAPRRERRISWPRLVPLLAGAAVAAVVVVFAVVLAWPSRPAKQSPILPGNAPTESVVPRPSQSPVRTTVDSSPVPVPGATRPTPRRSPQSATTETRPRPSTANPSTTEPSR